MFKYFKDGNVTIVINLHFKIKNINKINYFTLHYSCDLTVCINFFTCKC